MIFISLVSAEILTSLHETVNKGIGAFVFNTAFFKPASTTGLISFSFPFTLTLKLTIPLLSEYAFFISTGAKALNRGEIFIPAE